MLIFKMQAGLGNQMFIYAMARKMELRYNLEVKYDISSYSNYFRPYQLPVFNVSVKYADPHEISAVRDGKNLKPFDDFLFRFRRRFAPYYAKPHVIERSLNYSEEIEKFIQPTYYSGYWQSEKYFSSIADTIRKDFTFKSAPDQVNQSLLEQIRNTNAVSLHCRRGDFVNNPIVSKYQVSEGKPFFDKALKILHKKFGDIQLFIFSDDPEYVRHQLTFNLPSIYISYNLSMNKDFEDLRLMAACKHHIISSSTFSWWGAWLNPSLNKIVIAPKSRFKIFDDPYLVSNDYYPNGWILV